MIRVPGMRKLFRLPPSEDQVASDVDDEIAFHLEERTRELVARGMAEEEARAESLREFGDVGEAKAELEGIGRRRVRRMLRSGWWSDLRQDLRYALRSALRNPGFTGAAVLTLALAIGGTTTLFSFVYFALLRPLPFDQPDRIVRLYESRSSPTSPLNFLDWKAHNRVFEEIAAFQQTPRTIQTPQGVEQIGGMRVSAGFFTLLGTDPIHGRKFLPQEDRPGADRVVILSHDFWQRRLGGDPGSIGKPLALNDERFIVIGVLPPAFRFTVREVALWMPLRLGEDSDRMNRDERYLHVIARLREGITSAQAKMDMDGLAQDIASAQGATSRSTGVDVIPLQDDLVGNLRVSLLVLFGAAALVLLIGCSNLTNLLLARSLVREGELTIRFALGARRLRIMRQLITESTLIGLLGGAAGILITTWGIKAALPLLSRIGGSYTLVASLMMDVSIDRYILVFGMPLSLAAAALCAIVSAAHGTSSSNLHGALHAGRGTIASRRRARLWTALVVAEIGLTFVLLVGAGLLLNSLWRLRQVDLGFDPTRIVTMRLNSSPREAIDFYRNVLDRVRVLPDIESATVVSSLPLLGVDLMTGYAIENRPPVSDQETPHVAYKVVGEQYFEALKIPLLEGRYFDQRDAETRAPVVIVNQALAQEHWPNESPIGRRIQRGGPGRPWSTIVGVVQDVKVSGPDTETPSEIYIPHSQFLLLPNSRLAMPNMMLVARTAYDPVGSIPLLRGQIRGLKETALITDVELMEEVLSRVIAPRELNTVLLTAFACVALALAIVGVYGVMSYTVTTRGREMGVRMALGAQRRQVVLLVLRQGLLLALLGVGIGLIGTLALTRWMSALLFEVDPADPFTLAALVLVVLSVSLIACYFPARRAVAMDPLVALRTE